MPETITLPMKRLDSNLERALSKSLSSQILLIPLPPTLISPNPFISVGAIPGIFPYSMTHLHPAVSSLASLSLANDLLFDASSSSIMSCGLTVI
jgi:hypothetical protein